MFYICLVGTRNLLGCDDLGCGKEALQTRQVVGLRVGGSWKCNSVLPPSLFSFLPSFLVFLPSLLILLSFPPISSFSSFHLPIPLSLFFPSPFFPMPLPHLLSPSFSPFLLQETKMMPTSYYQGAGEARLACLIQCDLGLPRRHLDNGRPQGYGVWRSSR